MIDSTKNDLLNELNTQHRSISFENVMLDNIKNYDFQDFLGGANTPDELLMEEERDQSDIACILRFYSTSIEKMHASVRKDIFSCRLDFSRIIAYAYDGGIELLSTYNIQSMTDAEIIGLYANIDDYNANNISNKDAADIAGAIVIRGHAKNITRSYIKYLLPLCLIAAFFVGSYMSLVIFFICGALILLLFQVRPFIIKVIRSSTNSTSTDYNQDNDDVVRYRQIRDKHVKIAAYKEMVKMNLRNFINRIAKNGIRTDSGSMLTIADFMNALLYSDTINRAQAVEIITLLEPSVLCKVLLYSGRGSVMLLVAMYWRHMLFVVFFALVTVSLKYAVEINNIFGVLSFF